MIQGWYGKEKLDVSHSEGLKGKVAWQMICLTIKSLFGWWSFSFFLWSSCVIWGWYWKEKLDACHSWGFKGQGHENKENDRHPKKLCFLNKFSLSVPKET